MSVETELSATPEDVRALRERLHILYPYEWHHEDHERCRRLEGELTRLEQEKRASKLVLRLVEPDVFEIGLTGTQTAHKRANAGLRTLHTAISNKRAAPVPSGMSDTALRNQITRAGAWVKRHYPELAHAFTFGEKGSLRIEDGLLFFTPPRGAPKIHTS